ncbi:hypothetical protein ACFOYW_01845 [Gryllotalpicola reticulitermitis]|uniref:Uncharacterized protein n=1 Tax=Gryllotalpicola reticulitermitis TaxID=1184153 RepID=A0ABV8Q1G4_9MICO
MSVYFGLITAVVFSIISAIVVAALGFRDGDRAGDARVTVRAVHPGGDVPARCAEIEVDNRHESPVVVSARSCRASALMLVFASPNSRRTAITHRRGLDGIELLGAVEGHGIRRYVLPVENARGATRVTVFVDQVARRTRVTTATLRPARSVSASAAWPPHAVSPRDAADA